jgi:hypothetical protein
MHVLKVYITTTEAQKLYPPVEYMVSLVLDAHIKINWSTISEQLIKHWCLVLLIF